MKMNRLFVLTLTLAAAFSLWAAEPTYVSGPVVPSITPALRDLPRVSPVEGMYGLEGKQRDTHGKIVPDLDAPPHDNPLAALQAETSRSALPSPNAFGTPIVNVEGMDYGVYPPDPTGDVGPNHVVQGVNGSTSMIRVLDKFGATVLSDTAMQSLATASPCTSGYCDPIILYDRAADRWIISEFDSSIANLCVYVSRTPDPTGEYYYYPFNPPGTDQDYPHYGVWPAADNSAYFVGANNGGNVIALERDAMLAGDTARLLSFTIADLSGFGFQLTMPSNFSGPTLPPANSGGFFIRPVDTEIHGGTCTNCDYMEVWEFKVTWGTTPSGSFTQLANVEMTDWDQTVCGTSQFGCMAQPGTTVLLDPIREPAHFPLQYRNWGSYETLVGSFVEDVDGSDTSAAHWFEFRRTPPGTGNWTVYQEGVLADDGYHRGVTSAAMDGSGNIAMGYTRTSASASAGAYYAGRLATDPLDTLSSTDNLIRAGTSYQSGADRWGDYAGMAVDPTDDCTFWFFGMYEEGTNDNATRIASFKFDQCGCASIPAAPVAGASAPQNNRIAVTWNDSATTTITRYWVYRSLVAGGPYTQIAEVADTSPGVGGGPSYTYNDDTVSGGTRYYYVVRSNDGVSCTSPYSTEVNALATGTCTLPPTFAGLTSAASAGSATCAINLVWSAGTSNCSGTVTYNIYRATTSGFTPGGTNRIATGRTGTSFSDSGTLVSGTTYYYVVRAVDSVNASEETNLVERSATAAGPVSSSTLTETFEDTADGFDLTGWTNSIISGSTNWAWSTAQAQGGTRSWLAADQASVSDKVLVTPAFGVLSNTTVAFYHRYAFEGTSTCFDGGTLEYAVGPGYTAWTVVPDAYFTANGFNGTVSTSYSNPIGGKRAWCFDLTTWTQVTINLSTLNGQTIKLRWHEGDDSSTGDTGWYVDTVVLTNVGSAGTCTTGSGCTAPGAPTLSSATGDCNGVNLSWTAGTGTTESYNVYRSANPSCPVGTVTKLNGVPLAGTTYSDTTAVAGTSYTYVIRGACDAGGLTESGDSNCLAAARSAAPVAPGAPAVADVDACVQSGVRITWSGVGGATSYDLQVDGTTLVTGVASPYVYDPGDTAAHAYAVRANNSCGSGSFSSGTSGTDAAGVLSAPGAPTVTDVSACALSGLTVTWGAVPGATGYDLLVDGTTTVSDVDSGYVHAPGNSSAHTYAVQAKSGSCTSGYSGSTPGTDGAFAPPSVGTLTMSASGTKMILSWTEFADPSQADYYEVMRALLPAGPFDTSVGTAAGTIHGLRLDTASEPPTAYYKVRAVKNGCAGPMD